MNRPTALLLLALCWALQVQAADLTASVDRTQLNAGESVELTLESNDATQFGKPDLSPLDTLFEVHDTRQVNQLQTLGDNTPATTRWITSLVPKVRGVVVIPALNLGEMKSQAITLQVANSNLAEDGSTLAPVFIDSRLDASSVYVQAQAILTLRVYHSVALYDDTHVAPLLIPDARVEPLGEVRTYEKLINGVRHGVIEQQYAIYPQHSGELKIPAQLFSATQADAEPNAAGERPGKLLHLSSSELTLTVKPKPSGYPADAPWLPARSLSLTQNWSPEPDHNQIGDSLTRSLIITAQGLSSAQLPPLPGTEVSGLRRYPDQPVLTNQTSENGLIGSREEREALVPSRSGAIELPAIEVVWWNTQEDHLQRSSLPARTLDVAENPGLKSETPINVLPPAPVKSRPLWPWQLSTLLLACTTLLGFALWWRARRQPAILRAAQTGPSPRSLLDDLRRATAANDPQATRQALDAWARQHPETLAEMAARFVPLSDALDGLNAVLYSETGHHWQGAELWRAIRAIPAIEPGVAPVGDSLPPLYPK